MLLGKAVAEGEVEIVRDLLARGADPNRLEEDSSPIEWAMTLLSNSRPDVVRDVFACIELCLDAGADPNVMWDGPTTYGDCGTPLGEAVTQARPEFVRLLLSAGADPLEVSVGFDPGAETNPIQADWSDSEEDTSSEGLVG